MLRTPTRRRDRMTAVAPTDDLPEAWAAWRRVAGASPIWRSARAGGMLVMTAGDAPQHDVAGGRMTPRRAAAPTRRTRNLHAPPLCAQPHRR